MGPRSYPARQGGLASVTFPCSPLLSCMSLVRSPHDVQGKRFVHHARGCTGAWRVPKQHQRRGTGRRCAEYDDNRRHPVHHDFPTPDYATDKQIASVVAGGEKLWRDAADKGTECRIKYVEKGGGALGEIERKTCYTNELTASMSAPTAIRDLSQLRIRRRWRTWSLRP